MQNAQNGNKLAWALRDSGMSRTELAEKMGVDRRTIFRWENGLTQLKKGVWARILSELNIKLEDIPFDLEDQKVKSEREERQLEEDRVAARIEAKKVEAQQLRYEQAQEEQRLKRAAEWEADTSVREARAEIMKEENRKEQKRKERLARLHEEFPYRNVFTLGSRPFKVTFQVGAGFMFVSVKGRIHSFSSKVEAQEAATRARTAYFNVEDFSPVDIDNQIFPEGVLEQHNARLDYGNTMFSLKQSVKLNSLQTEYLKYQASLMGKGLSEEQIHDDLLLWFDDQFDNCDDLI